MPMNPPTHNPANVLPISSGTSFNESERSDQARKIANINVVTKKQVDYLFLRIH